ncbi:MAG: hypothetical protein ACU0CI_00155 [Shimia sp.]
MKVLDILVSTLQVEAESATVFGEVRFEVEEPGSRVRNLKLSCAAPLSRHIRPEVLLISDGIRQLRRLPEVRSGEMALSFAKGLVPLDGQGAKVA